MSAEPRSDAPASHPPGAAAARPGWTLRVGIALTLIALVAHAWQYRFLTDDAYISFRYARNLSHGFGLVFNPGLERVEGYSNFLWVLILAGLDRVGLAPERAANALSLALTVVLWAALARFLWRRSPDAPHDWTILVALATLAAARSFAVWSTGGLETRLFELLAVLGVLRLVDELEPVTPHAGANRLATAPDTGPAVAPRRVAPLGAVLLGLAALTRPDGVLIAGCALTATAALDAARGRFRVRAFAARVWPCALMIAAQLAFRAAYYHDLVPNTYYAKVGGRALWGSGLRYLAAFVLEYSWWLWLPLIAAAVAHAARRRAPALPALALGVLIPHTLYVVAIGGDHFEYRPLDLWFPLFAVLLPDGLRAWAAAPRRTLLTGGYACALIAGLFWIPAASRREFPDHYIPAFPGAWARDPEALAFLDPARDPLLRLPPFEIVARAHRDLTRWLTKRFVAVRQEEHRMFLAGATAEAYRLRALMDRGVLPRDVRLAMSSVGVIPYVTDAPTIDRLGLTDAHVSHLPFTTDLMAHGKYADVAYARARGVDLWFYDPVYAHEPLLSRRLVKAVTDSRHLRQDVWAAEVARDTFLLCVLPQGPAAAARRMPNLVFHSLRDSVFAHQILGRAIDAQREEVRRAPRDVEASGALALLLLSDGRFAEAEPLYREILRLAPEDPGALDQFAACQIGRGDLRGAAATLARELESATRAGNARGAATIERTLRAIEAALPRESKPAD